MAKDYNWRKFKAWNYSRLDEKLNEGPAYEYVREVKNIEKLKAAHDKEIDKLVKKIAKQDKKSAKEIMRLFTNTDREYEYFKNQLEDILNKLG